MQLVASRFQGLFEWSPCSKTNTIQTMMKWLWLRLVIHVIVPKLALDLLFAVSKAADSPKEVTSALRGWGWLLNLLYPPELSWKVSRKYRIYDWQCSTSLSLARHWSGSGRIITPIMDSRKICYFFNPRDVCVKDLKCENRGATCLVFTSPFRASTMPRSGSAFSFSVSWLEIQGPLLYGGQRCPRTIRYSVPRLPYMPGKTFPFIKWSLGNIFSGSLQHQLSNYAMKPMFPARLWMLCSNFQARWLLTRYSTTMPLRTTIFLQ